MLKFYVSLLPKQKIEQKFKRNKIKKWYLSLSSFTQILNIKNMKKIPKKNKTQITKNIPKKIVNWANPWKLQAILLRPFLHTPNVVEDILVFLFGRLVFFFLMFSLWASCFQACSSGFWPNWLKLWKIQGTKATKKKKKP